MEKTPVLVIRTWRNLSVRMHLAIFLDDLRTEKSPVWEYFLCMNESGRFRNDPKIYWNHHYKLLETVSRDTGGLLNHGQGPIIRTFRHGAPSLSFRELPLRLDLRVLDRVLLQGGDEPLRGGVGVQPRGTGRTDRLRKKALSWTSVVFVKQILVRS